MNNFFDIVVNTLDAWIVAIVLCSGFFQKIYLKGIVLNKKSESYDSALKTLALSFIVSLIYIYLLKDPDKASNWSKYFFSYFAATSLYELLIEPFAEWIRTRRANK